MLNIQKYQLIKQAGFIRTALHGLKSPALRTSLNKPVSTAKNYLGHAQGAYNTKYKPYAKVVNYATGLGLGGAGIGSAYAVGKQHLTDVDNKLYDKVNTLSQENLGQPVPRDNYERLRNTGLSNVATYAKRRIMGTPLEGLNLKDLAGDALVDTGLRDVYRQAKTKLTGYKQNVTDQASRMKVPTVGSVFADEFMDSIPTNTITNYVGSKMPNIASYNPAYATALKNRVSNMDTDSAIQELKSHISGLRPQ